MGKFIDLTGQKFNRLTVVKRAESRIKPNGSKVTQWWCKCDCGNEDLVLVSSSNLTNQHTKSCGRLRIEKSIENGKRLKGKSNLKNKKYNVYDLSGEYGIGYLKNGEEFYFDLEDYELIKDYCWWKNDEGYLVTSLNDNKKIRMSRLVMNENNLNIRIDHRNHNTMNNRKSNLRRATSSENAMNSELSSVNTSGVTGVLLDKKWNKWVANIMVNYKSIHLGRFDKFDDAVKARKEAEEKYFGKWSYDNSMKNEKE